MTSISLLVRNYTLIGVIIFFILNIVLLGIGLLTIWSQAKERNISFIDFKISTFLLIFCYIGVGDLLYISSLLIPKYLMLYLNSQKMHYAFGFILAYTGLVQGEIIPLPYLNSVKIQAIYTCLTRSVFDFNIKRRQFKYREKAMDIHSDFYLKKESFIKLSQFLGIKNYDKYDDIQLIIEIVTHYNGNEKRIRNRLNRIQGGYGVEIEFESDVKIIICEIDGWSQRDIENNKRSYSNVQPNQFEVNGFLIDQNKWAGEVSKSKAGKVWVNKIVIKNRINNNFKSENYIFTLMQDGSVKDGSHPPNPKAINP